MISPRKKLIRSTEARNRKLCGYFRHLSRTFRGGKLTVISKIRLRLNMNNSCGEVCSPVFEKEFPVFFHDLDSSGSLGPAQLLNFIQTTANMHTLKLGISAAHLRPKGYAWVASRIHLVVERYPQGEEIIQLRTWPSTRGKTCAGREFELKNEDGQLLGCATSSWVLINIKTRCPVRLDGNLQPYPLLPKRALDDDFAPLPPFPDPTEPEFSFRVLRSDLDINHHVNNTVYVVWALETTPETVATGRLTELEISFKAEALYGETIVSRCAVQNMGTATHCLHQIVNQKDGKELARLRTVWQCD